MQLTPERMAKMLHDSKLYMEMSGGTKAKNWYALIGFVAKIHAENIALRYEHKRLEREMQGLRIQVETLLARKE